MLRLYKSQILKSQFRNQNLENSKQNFERKILFSTFSLMFYHILFETQMWIKGKYIWISYVNFKGQCCEIRQRFRVLRLYQSLLSSATFYLWTNKHIRVCRNFPSALWPCILYQVHEPRLLFQFVVITLMWYKLQCRTYL